jgi:3-hydroxyacyl-CoA dehydrogenase
MEPQTSPVSTAVEEAVAVVTVDWPPVNALSQPVRAGLVRELSAAVARDDIHAVVLICAGRTFIAGADITEFASAMGGPSLQAVQRVLDESPKPVVAAIHGTALGGGLEIALTCHFRIAVPSARCGLPEVKIGILPGAGGTQRLPRLIGPEAALEWITSGEHVDAERCMALGVVDEICPEGELRAAAIRLARTAVAEGLPLRRVRDLEDKVAAARGRPEIFAAFRAKHARAFRGFLAPEACIQCVEAAVSLPFEAGLAEEQRLFRELQAKGQAAAQQYVFFAERQVRKIPDVSADTPQIPIARVGIIGAGTMGGGIAMCFANIGIPTTLVEREQKALDRGLGVVRRNYERSASRGRFSMDEAESRLARITGTLEMSDLRDCDLVIEAVFERMDIKQSVFRELDRIVKPGAILATNTSGLDIDQIAAVTGRPESVIGMHFFSPANVMRLVEVVRGALTSKPVIATTMEVSRKLGKIAVLVGVCRGFVGNRILYARQAQTQALLAEGAMPWDIDRVIYDLGLPMGPFAMSDLAGLDIGWSRERSRSDSLRDRLCEMDRRGQKTGAGYYDYDADRTPTPSPIVESLIQELLATQGGTPRQISDQEILERCTYPMINEGARILEEGKAIRASDIDMVWVHGYGWPVYRGGPMYYADTVDLPHVIERLRDMEKRFGSAYSPARLLVETAEKGKKLHRQ